MNPNDFIHAGDLVYVIDDAEQAKVVEVYGGLKEWARVRFVDGSVRTLRTNRLRKEMSA
jgi:hypothetical protein